jgi:hypothetical protein
MDVGDWFALFRCALLIVVVIQYVPAVGNLANGKLVCAGEGIAATGTGAHLPVVYFSRVENPVETHRRLSPVVVEHSLRRYELLASQPCF